MRSPINRNKLPRHGKTPEASVVRDAKRGRGRRHNTYTNRGRGTLAVLGMVALAWVGPDVTGYFFGDQPKDNRLSAEQSEQAKQELNRQYAQRKEKFYCDATVAQNIAPHAGNVAAATELFTVGNAPTEPIFFWAPAKNPDGTLSQEQAISFKSGGANDNTQHGVAMSIPSTTNGVIELFASAGTSAATRCSFDIKVTHNPDGTVSLENVHLKKGHDTYAFPAIPDTSPVSPAQAPVPLFPANGEPNPTPSPIG